MSWFSDVYESKFWRKLDDHDFVVEVVSREVFPSGDDARLRTKRLNVFANIYSEISENLFHALFEPVPESEVSSCLERRRVRICVDVASGQPVQLSPGDKTTGADEHGHKLLWVSCKDPSTGEYAGEWMSENLLTSRCRQDAPPECAEAEQSVLIERVLQDAKWGVQNHDPIVWLAILSEEIGEVSRAAMDALWRNGDIERVREEAVQVAAVALAFVECLDRKDWSWFSGVQKMESSKKPEEEK